MSDPRTHGDEANAAFDPDALDRLVRFGGVKLLTAMVASFRANGRERIGSGRAAVAANDAAAATLAFHSLKSSAAQLGAVSLSRLCADAEMRAGESRLDEVARSLIAIEGAFDKSVAWMEAQLTAPPTTT